MSRWRRASEALARLHAILGVPGLIIALFSLLSFGFAGRGSGGMDPISLSDLAQYSGVQLPLFARLTSAIMTFAPSSANTSQVARPMPEPPPVMIATLSFSRVPIS